MSRPEPTTREEMHARFLESRARLGFPEPEQRSQSQAVLPDRDLRPTEIDALADALLRRVSEDDALASLPRPIMVSDVIAAVARRAGLTPVDLRSARRTAPIVRARHSAAWLARRLTLRSSPAIGRPLGLDHTSVLHAFRRIDTRREEDPALRAELDEIEADLRARFALPDRAPDPTSTAAVIA